MKLCIRRALVLLIAALFLLSAVPALAAESDEPAYVFDLAGRLSEIEAAALESAAREISERYRCGVYIGVINSMASYGYDDIEACAEDFFDELCTGYGPSGDGILLLLSMAGRDYDLDAHGDFGNTAFGSYARNALTRVFLDNFREDDWYGGFFDYLSECESMLASARDGHPVRAGFFSRLTEMSPLAVIIDLALAVGIAFLVCGALKKRMRSVRAAAEADAYADRGHIRIAVRDDIFTHSTVTRVHIDRSDSGGGGGGGGGGGHSHTSGKF